jgi:glycosyltransferase involved in cell wall biosynthesis
MMNMLVGTANSAIQVSVVVVVKNNKAALVEGFSRYRQLKTLGEIELIVIDGVSTDGTVEAIKENEDLIAYWTSEPDSGIYDAINKGIRASSGRYVIIIHSDDHIVPHKFDKVVRRLADCNYPVLACAANMMQNGKQRWVRRPRQLDPGFFLRSMPFSHNAVFIARQVYELFGLYRTDLRLVSDLDFLYRLYFSAVPVETLDYCIVESDLDGASGTQGDRLHEENVTIFQDQFPFLDRLSITELLKVKATHGGSRQDIDHSRLISLFQLSQDAGVDLAKMAKLVIDENPLAFARGDFASLLVNLPRSPKLFDNFKPFVPIRRESPTFVTIGVTTYNCEDTIERTITSLFLQGWANYEIIIVDDHSTDGTMAILETLRKRSPVPMKIYRHERNFGVASARNHIAAKAGGEYLMFCDDDDVSLPGRLQANLEQVEKIKRQDNGRTDHILCFTSREAIKTTGSKFFVKAAGADRPVYSAGVRDLVIRHHARVSGIQGQYKGESIAEPFSMGTGVGMYPTALIRAVGFHETFRRLEDIEFCLKASLTHNIIITGLKDPLYVQHVTNTKDKDTETTVLFSFLFLSAYADVLTNDAIELQSIVNGYLNMLPSAKRAAAASMKGRIVA